MASPKNTPMLDQYLSIKAEYPDTILFFRMGDFFEMFFDDAKTASRILEITLTSRNKKESRPIPMCGIPFRSVNNYVSKLIEKGFKVAICDQVEDASQAKGLVKREVVQVITPGMILDNQFLDADNNNFILSLTFYQKKYGLAALDISTGTFRVTETQQLSSVLEEIQRINPSEILVPDDTEIINGYDKILKLISDKLITHPPQNNFALRVANEVLVDQFHTRSLEGFGCSHYQAAIGAAGALLLYVKETQKRAIPHIVKLEPYELDNYLCIDDTSAQNLELTKNSRTAAKKGSLLGILDQTQTAMGSRLLTKWIQYPLLDANQINNRLDAVEMASMRSDIRKQIRNFLNNVYDLERLSGKIALNQCTAQDLTALKRSIFHLPQIWTLLDELNASIFKNRPDLDTLLETARLIDSAIREDAAPTIREGGIIKAGYNQELDELIYISRDGKQYLARLEAKERSETGINTLKVKFNKVFGYFIEVSKAQATGVPGHYVRKQTLVNAERFITDELKEFESKVLGAEEQRSIMEYEIFCEIREAVVQNNKAIHEAADFTAMVDCLICFADISANNAYIRPIIWDKTDLLIQNGRHPVIEKMITAERFVPNSITMNDSDKQIYMITGPNMSGKSTVLRQTALLVIMAQIGSFIPAESASMPVFDRIFTRVGASDNLSQGQSTFMVEMEETANILNNATSRSLIVMDEIGRGTSTYDGVSIAWAVAEFLHDWKNIGVKTLFATHYHELIALEKIKKRIKNFNIAVKQDGDQIIFLRQLKEGGVSQSYGIQVARLAGIPDIVINRAKDILLQIESRHSESSHSKPDMTETKTPKSDSKQHSQKKVIKTKARAQLSLFNTHEKDIVRQLMSVDVSNTTPLEALQFLAKLQKNAAK
ncbi:dNA mismatch repair protein MutS [Candidatus Magnetomorum sp. HK-1]|nr:dNA mismatch repair protein MutS [Candidatus Magnetomorum sp. HK-1]